MKKTVFFGFLAIMLVFSFIGCDTGNDDPNNGYTHDGGTLTLTGIPNNYNGKYAIFYAYGPVDEDGVSYSFAVGCQSINFETGLPTGVQVSSGSVDLPMITWNSDNQSVGYTGAGTARNGMLFLLNQRTVENWEDLWWRYSSDGDGNITDYELGEAIYAFRVFPNITFSKGSAAISWSDGFGYGETPQNQMSRFFGSIYKNNFIRNNYMFSK